MNALERNPVIFGWLDLSKRLATFNSKGKLLHGARFLRCWIMPSNRLKILTSWFIGLESTRMFVLENTSRADPTFRVADYQKSVKFCIDGHVQRQLQHLVASFLWSACLVDSGAGSSVWSPFVEELHSSS